MGIKLEGRIAGPWVTEVSGTWAAVAPRLDSRKLSLDLRDVTYLDDKGKQVLGAIYSQTGAELVTSTPWTQFLASEIVASSSEGTYQEAENANHA